MMESIFAHAWVRFATSGTLITCFGLADHLARRRDRGAPASFSPAWMKLVFGGALLAFYLLIGPAGGPLARGLGNLAGCALAGLAVSLRVGRWVRYPELAGKMMLSLALPLAAGVPWGLAVLGLPALTASLYCCRRAERLQPRPWMSIEAAPLVRFRMLPGIW